MSDTDLTIITDTVLVPRPDHDLIANVTRFAEAATKLVVTDAGSRNGAAAQLQEVATFARLVEANRKERTRILDEKKKEVMDAYRPLDTLLGTARSVLTQAITSFDRAEALRIREEQARLDREAEQRRAKLEERDEKWAERGNVAKAVELEAQAQMVPNAVVAAPPKAKGVSGRETWKFEVVNEKAIPSQFLMPDEGKIRAYVNAMKGDAEIPGVRIWREDALVVRGARP